MKEEIKGLVEEKKFRNLKELLANPNGSTISLDEIMNFMINNLIRLDLIKSNHCTN